MSWSEPPGLHPPSPIKLRRHVIVERLLSRRGEIQHYLHFASAVDLFDAALGVVESGVDGQAHGGGRLEEAWVGEPASGDDVPHVVEAFGVDELVTFEGEL